MMKNKGLYLGAALLGALLLAGLAPDAIARTLNRVYGNSLHVENEPRTATPSQTLGDDDAYINGHLEVDGVIHADGGVTGNAATATALAADPADAGSGFLCKGINAAGTCTISLVEDAATNGSTNPVTSNAVYDQLALKAALGGATFTGTVVMSSTLTVTPPAAQTIAAGGIVAADACGGLKRITSASPVTTDTTDAIAAPAAGNTGCCMDISYSGSHTVTLDNNAHNDFGYDLVLGNGGSVRVCSDGTTWQSIGEWTEF